MRGLRLAAPALAVLLPLAASSQDTLPVPQGIVAHGVPPIAAALAARLDAYAEFVPHALAAWHPKRREMLVQRGGGARTQLFLVNDPGVRPVQLTRLPAAIVAEWNRVGEPTAAVGRAIARLESQGDVDITASTDGRRLASVQVVDPLESHLWITEVATGKRRRLTRAARAEKVSYRAPRFSPDGRAIFATSDRGSEWRRLVRIPASGGAERVLTGHLRFDIDAFELSADAGRIAFTANEAGSHSLRFLDLETLQEQPRPPLFSGVIRGLAWRPGSTEVGFQLSGARAAGDVFSYDVAANTLARWTNGNSTRVNVSQFVEPRSVRWTIGAGIEVTAFHYHPPERFPGKRPVLVDFRAGASKPARAGFLGDRNYLVNELGIAVLHPNLRGAPGLGKSFRRLAVGPRRDESMNDVAAMLDWIRGQPDLDAERVLVAGAGRGGELALAAVGHPANLIAGAIALFPDRLAAPASPARPTLVVGARALPAAAGRDHWTLELDRDALARPEVARYVSSAIVEFAQKIAYSRP